MDIAAINITVSICKQMFFVFSVMTTFSLSALTCL